jgi:integrase
MPSVHRVKGSKYFQGAFRLPDGRRALRSTKRTTRSEAMKVVLTWQAVADNRMAEVQIRQVLSDIHKAAHGREIESTSVRKFAKRWIARKQREVKPETLRAYKTAATGFVEVLGDRADQYLGSVSVPDIAAVRDHWADRATPRTANNKLKIVRVMFNDAWRDGLILENPAAKVPALKTTESRRRPFTLEEIKKVLQVADDEWRGLVLAGLYTGQRLGDLVNLRWNQVDLQRGEIIFKTRKTGRTVIVPIAEPLLEWLLEHATDDPVGPLFERIFARYQTSRIGGISNAFYELLVTAGLAKPRPRRVLPGKGRDGARNATKLSFHSLRHTTTSWLKAAGAAEAVARDIIGHDSAAVSRHYTHIDAPTKSAAIAKLPNLGRNNI